MTIAKPATPTIIETISTGYTILNQRLWVLIIPFLLNLAIWLTPPLSLAPLFIRHHDKLSLVAAIFTQGAQQREQLVFQLQNADMREPLTFLNFIPTLPAATTPTPPFTLLPVISVHQWSSAGTAVLLLNLLALLLSSFFLTMLARGVRNSHTSQGKSQFARLRVTLTAALHIAGYLLIITAAVLVAGLPMLIFSAIAAINLPSIATPIILVWLVTGFWLYLYTGFAVEAILLSNTQPIRAMSASIRIVRTNFLATLGLLALSFLIVAGLEIIWRMLATSAVGMLAAIGGSAYIGSGLAVARMVFYRERFKLVQDGTA